MQLHDTFANPRDIKPADILDIRHLTETGSELHKRIVSMVSATQSPLLLTPLPNILIMTTTQYDQMQTDPELLGDYVYGGGQRVYITPLNAMDVRIIE